MAFTLQNDEGTVEGANAYIDVAYFTTYHTDAQVDAVVNGEYSETQIQGAIVVATRYADNSRRYKGWKLLAAQSTQFPRDKLYDRDGNLVEGLPTKLKDAIAEYALRALSSSGVGQLAPDPVADDRGLLVKSKTEKLGPLEETTVYADGKPLTPLRSYPAADMLLREYVVSGGGRTYR